MKKEELVEVPKQIQKKVKYFCDICKEEIKDSSLTNKAALSATVNCCIRYTYSYDDWRVELLDICEKCFVEKVQPLLEKEFSINFREDF